MRVDFHIHSSMSDGLLSPEILIQKAYEKKISMMAFTDHEYLTVTPHLTAMAESLHIRLITGAEFLTCYQGRDVHVLAYFEKNPSKRFLQTVQRLREQRTQAVYHLVNRLRNMGIAIAWSDVKNTEFPLATRTHSHVLYGLHKLFPLLDTVALRDILSSAFAGAEPLADYEPPPYEEMVDLIRHEGGFPVIAHPGLLQDFAFVKELISLRPVGLEVYYGYWYDTNKLIEIYARLAQQSAQAATGGSDYHGPFSRFDMGEIDFPADKVEYLLQTLKKYSLKGESR